MQGEASHGNAGRAKNVVSRLKRLNFATIRLVDLNEARAFKVRPTDADDRFRGSCRWGNGYFL